MNRYPTTFVTLIAGLLLSLGLFAPEADAGVGITSVTITTPSPLRIPCGGKATVTVVVGYRITLGGGGATRDVQLWESDWGWDDLLAQGTISVGAGDPQKGTKTISLTLSCDPVADCKCDLSGNMGKDDEHGAHTVYAYSGNARSAPITVFCVKDGGTIAMTGGPAVVGGGVTVPVAYVQDQPIATFGFGLSYDASVLSVQNFFIAPEVLAAFPNAQVDCTTPGFIYFTGSTNQDVQVDPFLFEIDFGVAPGAPLFTETLLDQLPAAVFLDQSGKVLPVAHADMSLTVFPFDVTPPSIDPSLVVLDVRNDQILGLPGAVSDDWLGSQPPVAIGAGLVLSGDPDPAFIGGAAVQPDGSFQIPSAGLSPDVLTVLLGAEDASRQTASTFTSAQVDLIGTPQTGQPAHFAIYDPLAVGGYTGITLLSCSGNSPGFPLPGDGRIVPLVFDGCTSLGLAFGPLLTGVTDPLGIAHTPTILFPPAPAGLSLFTAAVTLDPQSGQFKTITQPNQFTTK